MGRPISKHFFGPEGIEVQAKVAGKSLTTGFIVKQTSTREFIVDLAGEQFTVNMVEKAKTALVNGEMMIEVTLPGGTVVPAKTLKGHVVVAAGKSVVWATRSGTEAPAALAMVEEEEAPAPTPTPAPGEDDDAEPVGGQTGN